MAKDKQIDTMITTTSLNSTLALPIEMYSIPTQTFADPIARFGRLCRVHRLKQMKLSVLVWSKCTTNIKI
jgi:hypothetical protein